MLKTLKSSLYIYFLNPCFHHSSLVIKFHIALISIQLSNCIILVPHLRVFTIRIGVVGQNHNMSIFKHNSGSLAIADRTPEDEYGEPVQDFLLDQTSQRTSTIGG